MNARLFGWVAVATLIGVFFSSSLEAAPPSTDVELTINYKGKDRKVVFRLDEVNTPRTSANFKKLCQEGFYAGTLFHRVIPGYIVQAGDPFSKEPTKKGVWGTGGPGYKVPAELGQPHVKGAVAMARLGDAVNPSKESSGSQFYVSLDRIESLDGEYTVFANVISGMDVLEEIGNAAADKANIPLAQIEIKSATVLGEIAPRPPAAAAIPPGMNPADSSEPALLKEPAENPNRLATPAPAPPVKSAPAAAPEKVVPPVVREEPIRDITPTNRAEPMVPPTSDPALGNTPNPEPAPAPKPRKKKGGFTKFLERFW